jgi:hypothetical protein
VGRASAFSSRFGLEKALEGFPGLFCALWAFLEGVLENVDGKAWCFGGEHVVECVVNMVRKQRFVGTEK